MAGKTYKTRAIVLRKRKLSEKDLIVTLIDERGQLLQAVAKGARRPGGSFAARLELFSVVDLMLAAGRKLDVVTSAVFAPDAPRVEYGVEQAACAAALAEMLATLAMEDVPNERLFALAQAAFAAMGEAEPVDALALACSSLLKTLAYEGFRPMLTRCAVCGGAVAFASPAAKVPVSIAEGGAVCANCPRPFDAVLFDAGTLLCANDLLLSRFADVPKLGCETGDLMRIAEFVKQWVRFHLDKNPKALDFLLACGLF